MDENLIALAEKQAGHCQIFANPKRILILWALVKQEQSVTALAKAIGTSLQSTSQHLHLMRAASILDTRRDGQTIYYRVADDYFTFGCRHLLKEKAFELDEERMFHRSTNKSPLLTK